MYDGEKTDRNEVVVSADEARYGRKDRNALVDVVLVVIYRCVVKAAVLLLLLLLLIVVLLVAIIPLTNRIS